MTAIFRWLSAILLMVAFASGRPTIDEISDDEIVQKLSKVSGYSVEHLKEVRDVLEELMKVQGKDSADPITSLKATNAIDKEEQEIYAFSKHNDIAAYLYEVSGDILVSKELLAILREELQHHKNGRSGYRRKRLAPNSLMQFWDKTEAIVYTFDTGLPQKTRDAVKRELKKMTEKSCLNFEETNSEENKGIYISDHGDECYSEIGAMSKVYGRYQAMVLPDKCAYGAIAAHEFLHALNSFHEQSRYDRDDYVNVFLENIANGWVGEFAYRGDIMDTPYEYGSVMHYPAVMYEKRVMEPKDPQYLRTMGNRRSVTFNDYKALNLLYQCEESCPSQPACKNGGFTNSRDCSSCICPVFFEGALCEKMISTNYHIGYEGVL